MIELPESIPTLETPRLLLRALVPEDAPDVFAVFSDREVLRYFAGAPMSELAEAHKRIENMTRHFREKDAIAWGISRKEDGRVIGTCTLWKLDLEHRRAEIGYALLRAAWGRGFASEAMSAVFEYAFDRLDMLRLEADVDPRNDRSLVMLERLGWSREGYLPERYLIGGEMQDTVLLGMTASVWRSRRAGVRPMTHADRERVLSMLLVQLQEHDVPIKREVLAEAIDGVARRPELGAFLVLDRGDGPIGVAYLGFTWTLEHGGLVSWLEELYVLPEHRGRGLGAQLLDAAIAFAKARGARGLDLEVETSHERAANLYMRAGFQRLSRSRWQKRFLEL